MYFDLKALQSFHLYWREKAVEELLGNEQDLSIMKEEAWLQDSAVIDRIEQYKGQWAVSLVFADPSRKSTFIIRPIRVCPSHKNALVTANYMRRIAAKDPRGTVEVNQDVFAIYLN